MSPATARTQLIQSLQLAYSGEFGAVQIKANPRVMGLLHAYIGTQRVGV